ncbi:MAG: leucyl-tRNA synthetase [Luteibaculaceae bacterium]|jgi:leucyl-tRNA synthetase
MEYLFNDIEAKWQSYWKKNNTYAVTEDTSKSKFYVLDMFPYPSGAGLHVGHPLGYIASDIYARYKKHKGFNVLHPMGYDSFGLPAEQYAIETGQHPALTTEKNIERYRKQLDQIGFCYDWSREVRTSDPSYYKWTQWIFKQLFNAWYNTNTNKAESLDTLITYLEKNGSNKVPAFGSEELDFSAEDWKQYSEGDKEKVLQNYRLAFLSDTWVNWCPKLGTVLANDEVKDGKSERGGHPVEQRKMRQWSLRITAYAERLLKDLDGLDWSDAIKEIQRNWIGKSVGASVSFGVENFGDQIDVFTTRPDTIFGVSFMVLAPEHPLVNKITTADKKAGVEAYKLAASLKTERDRQSDVKNVTGEFTGAYAIHPFSGEKIPVWIADYVLASYGTGAVMAVPCGDQRDYDFAKKMDLPIPAIMENMDLSEAAFSDKAGIMCNSDFLDGLTGFEAIKKCIEQLEKEKKGKGKINFRLRDAIFSRQRYWGEPFPVYYKNDQPFLLKEGSYAELPEVDKYLPTVEGEPPLARAKKEAWNVFEGDRMEFNTMPGWAGSSWYFVRYMDPKNDTEFVAKEKVDYWQNVDLYFGGAEHATGHLLYSRFWTKFLHDMGHIPFVEPFQKMINQGMILGRSSFVYRLEGTQTFVSKGLIGDRKVQDLHVDINMVDGDVLDTEQFKNWRAEYADATFELEDGQYICGSEVEKMSKSKYNVQTPDDLVDKYGADTLRMYEMFLGPLEQFKPWDTKGITGVHNFLRKFWRLFHAGETFQVSDEDASKEEMKVLHNAIKRVCEDIERFSFNTVVSSMMIAANQLSDLKCNKKQVLEPMVVLLSPYAPHIAEELWQLLGNTTSVTQASYPELNPAYLVESTFSYPVSFNGKMRFKLDLPVEMGKEEIEKLVRSHDQSQKYLEGKDPKKVIVVPKRIINVVV